MLEGINPKDIDKITISLDSIEEKIHNKLRNNENSFRSAIRIIKFLSERNYNLRIQMTICDINYDTILSSVETLNKDYNINNFAFHCMSVSDRAKKNGLQHIDPFKWRKLVRNLFDLKKKLNNVNEYSVPIIAMTENELLKLYFGGDKDLLNKYLTGVPTNMCPAINGNNLYIKADDDDVYISRCQILFDTEGIYAFKFNYDTNSMEEIKSKSDYQFIKDCKQLCPAILKETNSNHDYVENEEGKKLYYVCRVLLANEEDLIIIGLFKAMKKAETEYIKSILSQPLHLNKKRTPTRNKYISSVVPIIGAGSGNRTRIASLEGWNSTIELHLRLLY